jgi:acyl-CoA thioesterase
VSEFTLARVEDLLGSDNFARSLGIKVVSVDSEVIKLTMDVTSDHLNFLGIGHGGVVFSLADCAFSLASNHAGARAVAIDTHLVLTGGAELADTMEVSVREMTRGRTLGTYQAEVRRGDGRTIGLFTGTVLVSPG